MAVPYAGKKRREAKKTDGLSQAAANAACEGTCSEDEKKP